MTMLLAVLPTDFAQQKLQGMQELTSGVRVSHMAMERAQGGHAVLSVPGAREFGIARGLRINSACPPSLPPPPDVTHSLGHLRRTLPCTPPQSASTEPRLRLSPSLSRPPRSCNSRIQYKKTCPIHGEVPSDEIVSGYEYTKGQYVVIDTDELDKLRSESDRSINVTTFAAADSIDPVYHSGKNYRLPCLPAQIPPEFAQQRDALQSLANQTARR